MIEAEANSAPVGGLTLISRRKTASTGESVHIYGVRLREFLRLGAFASARRKPLTLSGIPES
ncbi:hypothetical protein GCM10010198_42330 [Nocardia seriolae]